MSEQNDIPENGAPQVAAAPAPAEKTASSDSGKPSAAEGAAKKTAFTGEVVDRLQRRMQKKKAADEKAAAEAASGVKPQKAAPDEATQALRKGHLAQQKKAKTKKYMQIGGVLAGLVVLKALYGFLFDVPQARKVYGVCKIYLELKERFPKDIQYVGLEDLGDNIRVWYRRVDPFGVHHVETIRCYFKRNEQTGQMLVDKILIDRREEPTEAIDRFNVIMPVVMKNLPNLDWPGPSGDKTLDNIIVDRAAVRAAKTGKQE